MTFATPVIRSRTVYSVAEALSVEDDRLAEMRETTLATRDAWDAKREARSRKILTLRFGEMDNG